MNVSELFPGIEDEDFYLAEMRGHGHPLDPQLPLSEIDNYNLNHFTYREDCHAEVYAEIVRRLRQAPFQTYNGVAGDLFISLVNAPVQKLPAKIREKVVALFYDVEALHDSIKEWKRRDDWQPYVEY